MEYRITDKIKNLEANAIREIFGLLKAPGMISFAGGFPAAEALPVAEVEKIASELLSGEDTLAILQYGGTEGYGPLINSALKYAARFGIKETSENNALIISGGQQGIDLTFKAFLNKGDRVLVEDPTYLACLHILKTYEGEPIGVKADSDGVNIEDLEEKIKRFNPKIVYLIPDFSNPTGKSLSLEKRKAAAALAEKYNVIVLEDNPYGELRYSGERLPAIKAFDNAGRVIYVSSFSKTIAPGLRTGIAVADEYLIKKLTICKQAVDVHTPTLSQAIVDRFLRKGLLQPHLDEIIPLYRTKKEAMTAAIARCMPEEIKFTNPDGGLFIWGEFSVPFDTGAAFKEAAETTRAAYVPGKPFFADGLRSDALRFNFSNSTLAQIEEGVKRLADFFKSKLAKKY